ncbi:hypothetical protein FB45DRAFT_1032555 [Roridomyces roridus]|uniref:Uncharacterized protein n=1 Tax=Roridomyces roridus TaxID=1738132 RepID=A0AAD7FI43_9AGAR|nr:hypothetical protein FB45DRAFT_1032555 [Roridomyces roridus]
MSGYTRLADTNDICVWVTTTAETTIAVHSSSADDVERNIQRMSRLEELMLSLELLAASSASDYPEPRQTVSPATRLESRLPACLSMQWDARFRL